MSSSEAADHRARGLRTLRLFNGALLAGVLAFLAIACVLRLNRPQGLLAAQPFALGFGPGAKLATVAVLLTVMNVAMALVVPSRIVASQRNRLARSEGRKLNDSLLLAAYQTARVLYLVLLEGAAFFCLIVFLIDGSGLTLLLALALMAGMLIGFPTESRLESWLDQQHQLLRMG
jgi:hypothetical protein